MVLGKSTLAKIIMGIEKQDSGQVILDGKDISKKKIDERAKLGIAFAFQQPVKFKGITVYDLLKLSAKKEITRKEACEILSKVGLCAKEYVDKCIFIRWRIKKNRNINCCSKRFKTYNI